MNGRSSDLEARTVHRSIVPRIAGASGLGLTTVRRSVRRVEARRPRCSAWRSIDDQFARCDSSNRPRRRLLHGSIVVLFFSAGSVGTMGGALPASAAHDIGVGHRRGCFPTVQAALDVATAGDVVRIDAGVFAGGVTVNKDLSLVGAGAGATLLRGGGPVLTIGVFEAVTEPTVSIRGLTVTGGVTHTSTHCGPNCALSYVDATALGGGVVVPPGVNGAHGATVSIIDSVIAGNRAAPTMTVPSHFGGFVMAFKLGP